VRAYVTGATGFVGRHLGALLHESGDVNVTPDSRVEITAYDEMVEALRYSTPDVVFHLAARSSVAASLHDAAAVTRTNVVGTQVVLDAARAAVPKARIIVVSSSEVYGAVDPSDQPTPEQHPVAPRNPYASSKVEMERVAHEASQAGQRVIVVRPFTHIGPGQSTAFVVPALTQRLLEARERGDPSVVVGNLAARRDFTDVRDVVRAYRLLALLGVDGDIYNVASGHNVALSEEADELRDLVHPSCGFVVDTALLRPADVASTRGDATKLHDATGWEPRVTLSATLRDVVAFFASNISPDEKS